METVSYTWFNNSRGCIGIVLAKTDYGQQAYISSVDGFNEEADVELVKNWGAKLTIEQAKGFFGSQVDEEHYGKL